MQQRRRHRRHTTAAQGMYQAHASSMPVHNRCNEIKNRSFISSHACIRADDIGDTLQLDKACTKARASSMPVHNRCNEVKNKTLHFLAVTHATEATTQETHCSCTRHVSRCVPRPSPCTIGVMKSKTDHFSALTHVAEAMPQETHCYYTRHVPRRLPCPCPCTADFNRMKYINKKFISILTCNKGHDTRGVNQACTEARTSSMSVHKRL